MAIHKGTNWCSSLYLPVLASFLMLLLLAPPVVRMPRVAARILEGPATHVDPAELGDDDLPGDDLGMETTVQTDQQRQQQQYEQQPGGAALPSTGQQQQQPRTVLASPSHLQQQPPSPQPLPQQQSPPQQQSQRLLSPECGSQGSMEAGRCVCVAGRGGPACGFSLRSVFGEFEVYSSHKRSDRMRPLDLQGWSPTADRYERYLEKMDAVTVIEVGVWKGKSAAYMAKWLQQRQRGVLVAVDSWLGAPEFWAAAAMNSSQRGLFLVDGWPTVYYSFLSNMVHEGLEEMVVPVPQTSKLATILLRAHGLTADLIHIDAAHEYGSVKEDIHLWWPFLRHGGMLLGDDFKKVWPGVQKAAQEFALLCDLELVVEAPKWYIIKPDAAWFEARPELPIYCTRGAYEHYMGVREM